MCYLISGRRCFRPSRKMTQYSHIVALWLPSVDSHTRLLYDLTDSQQLYGEPPSRTVVSLCRRCNRIQYGGKSFFHCGGCYHTQYCSPECQKLHWEQHRKECKHFMRDGSELLKSFVEFLMTNPRARHLTFIFTSPTVMAGVNNTYEIALTRKELTTRGFGNDNISYHTFDSRVCEWTPPFALTPVDTERSIIIKFSIQGNGLINRIAKFTLPDESKRKRSPFNWRGLLILIILFIRGIITLSVTP